MRRTVQVKGYPVYYSIVGEGEREPVILVHGLSASSRWWVRNVHSLAERYTVYLIELPGFGTMWRSRSRLVLQESGDWLAQWMEAVGIRQAHLIGHSMGGSICLSLAAQRPELVRSLVLVSPTGLPGKRSIPGYLLSLVLGLPYLTFSFFLILAYDALRAGPVSLLHTTLDIIAQDIRAHLNLVTAPTLLVWGEYDTLVPPAFGEVLRKEIVHSRLLVLKRAAHVSMYDQPHEFNQAVLAFLAGEPVGR
jgi:pimeloyl-ACP methyl ester carboxylesterase